MTTPTTPAATTAVQTRADKLAVDYVPYGAGDKVRLNVEIVQKFIAVPTRSGKTCSEKDAVKFMAMCQAKRLNPWEGDCFLIGFDGKDGQAQFSMFTAHQAFLKRAELHPEFDGMKSGLILIHDGALTYGEGDFFLDDQEVLGGWATVHFKTRRHPMHKTLKLSRFKKTYGLWVDDPAGMIVKCAECDALRSAFPTMNGGLYLRDEIDVSSFGMTVDAPLNRKPPLELVAETTQASAPAETEAEKQAEIVRRSNRKQEERKKEVVKSEPLASTQNPVEATGTQQSIQQSLKAFIDSVSVGWDDFRGFLVSSGIYPDAESCATIDDLPIEVCQKAVKDSAAMSKMVKLYGAKQAAPAPAQT